MEGNRERLRRSRKCAGAADLPATPEGGRLRRRAATDKERSGRKGR